MGQKLQKLSEKDEESLDRSDWSGQTEETEQSETARPDESRDQDGGSFATPLANQTSGSAGAPSEHQGRNGGRRPGEPVCHSNCREVKNCPEP
ncbi:hypothetical protein JOQ06_008662 [Pogonophryne albipinna]|uniref:Uncharacterized protein n=1 Tax=Pogonophryne albipinna TaxID=1090488 RepID=A0AAD6F9C0_9TELE|nr:hypothetical protein JOQ06_008662 [Pogonophryne albipinna]